jgi:ABC-type oligopeptide transport system ATPase subunit
VRRAPGAGPFGDLETACIRAEELAASGADVSQRSSAEPHRAGPVVEVTSVKVFPVRRAKGCASPSASCRPCSDVSFSIGRRKTLGLVGESGSGKSTLGRCVLQLIPPSAGSVKYNGRALVGLSRDELRPVRREMQMVFRIPTPRSILG